MITEQDLKEAIAECEGTRNPTSSTCVKLAAYYTILNQLYGNQELIPNYSFSSGPVYEVELPYSKSRFSKEVKEKGIENVFPIIDDLMDAIMVINPKLYQNTIDKISDL